MKRVALVVGNSRYEPEVGPLRNTVNDAKAMAKTLRTLGFFVVEKHDVTRDQLMAALIQFRSKLHGAEVGVFYFAGHGLSVGGSNYLLPIRSGYTPDGASETDRRLLAETKLLNAEQAIADMNSSGAPCNLAILDACRTTPVARNPQSRDAAAAGGLVEMSPPAGSLVAFATDAGHAANDGAGANGLYTEELMRQLLTPGLSIEQVFKRTRAAVMQRSGGAQVPAEYSRLVGDDIFLAGAAPLKPVEDPAPRAEMVQPPTFADINKLASAGDAAGCVQALRRRIRIQGASAEAVGPLAALLEGVKESLRDPKTAIANSDKALQTCDVILGAIHECVPQAHPQSRLLLAKASNRRGDALLLLSRPKEALDSFDTAKSFAPEDGYVLYNRARSLWALNRLEEAKAEFTAASGPKFKKSGVRRLAQEALAEMEREALTD